MPPTEAPERALPVLNELADQPDDAAVNEAVEEGGSVLERLKRRREQLGADRTEVFDIPGYNGELAARYKPVDFEMLKKLLNKIDRSKNPRIELLVMADILIMACDEILVRADGKLGPLDPKADEPVRYDDRLAEFFGFEAANARQVVFGVFNNDIAIPSHHKEVLDWMQGVTQENTEDLLGESQGDAR